MLKAVKLILEESMHNSKHIQTKVTQPNGRCQLRVESNNFAHLQGLLTSVISIDRVYLEEYDSARDTDESYFVISIH